MAVPELLSRNLLASFLPADGARREQQRDGRLTWADVAYLVGLGMDLQIDGTKDDTGMTSKASPAAAIAETEGHARSVHDPRARHGPAALLLPERVHTDAFVAAS